ncbi:hypothetical protein E2C01_080152 [Portunus trituberculatus]|uniref:Uncharacterized protein n=1 Tax=Portunus trituberculatus TaxID=210409 RepID=A0A5B7ILE6_PORTR|nr:hypothetical protein [Portunus trituberculatus]
MKHFHWFLSTSTIITITTTIITTALYGSFSALPSPLSAAYLIQTTTVKLLSRLSIASCVPNLLSTIPMSPLRYSIVYRFSE